jgi:hypothetical protein
MSKVHKNFTSEFPTMKALILYNDFASAAKANAALQRSAQNVDPATRWDVKPWRVDMLRFPPTAEEALIEAIDAHLIVFAGGGAQALPFWLLNWLEHWAKCRRIDGASLAAIDSKRSGTFATPAASELASFAKRHGLSFIPSEGEVIEGKIISSIQVAIMDAPTRRSYKQEFKS